jgi:transcriptional regulator with XRE-family HTH domain
MGRIVRAEPVGCQRTLAPRAHGIDSRRVDTRSGLLESSSTMLDSASAPSTEDIDARIARQVRSLRAELGLTLEALAAKCGVSRSMISLVERGESSPTASVLEKIAAGLDAPLATLFQDAHAATSPLSRRTDRSAWRDPQTGYVRRNISPANYPSPIQLVEVTLPAGARVAYEAGVREVRIHQQIWLQEGSMELSVGRDIYRLTKDDCLAFELDAPTTFRNRTRKAARYVVVITSEPARRTRR